MLETVEQIIHEFKEEGNYVSDRAIATAVMLAFKLGKPLLVEGEAGVGKTELAKVVASNLNRELIRLQCYEGIDEAHILYEWAYAKQLLYAAILQGKVNSVLSDTDSISAAIQKVHQEKDAFFSYDFLQMRPLLKALTSEEPVVLLIDEIDRSDREMEAFLLEALSDYQVSIPELGTIQAKTHPLVILTSNNTRELSDALKRRCIYLYIDLPAFEQELEILQLKVPSLKEHLAVQIVEFVQKIRKEDWKKIPSISESIDWAAALIALNIEDLNIGVVTRTINLLLKNKSDIRKSRKIIARVLDTE